MTSPATLDWFGCATFRLRIGELVIFLDAYLDRVPSAPRVELVPEDLERADWIVVGHSHFDHLYGTERIARRTGARILGSHETVRVMEAQGVPLAQLVPVAGGEKVRLSEDVSVDVYPSQHSCVWSQTAMAASDEVCLGDLGLTLQEQEQRFAALAAHSCSASIRPRVRSSTRTPPDTGAESCATCVPTWRSPPPRGAGMSTASRSRARSRTSSRDFGVVVVAHAIPVEHARPETRERGCGLAVEDDLVKCVHHSSWPSSRLVDTARAGAADALPAAVDDRSRRRRCASCRASPSRAATGGSPEP